MRSSLKTDLNASSKKTSFYHGAQEGFTVYKNAYSIPSPYSLFPVVYYFLPRGTLGKGDCAVYIGYIFHFFFLSLSISCSSSFRLSSFLSLLRKSDTFHIPLLISTSRLMTDFSRMIQQISSVQLQNRIQS